MWGKVRLCPFHYRPDTLDKVYELTLYIHCPWRVLLFLLLMRGLFGDGGFQIVLYIGIALGLLATVLTLSIGLGVAFGAQGQDKATNAKWRTYDAIRVIAQGITVLCGAILLATN